MIVRRFRRLAVPLALGVAALGLTSCSHTTSDAATVTYRDASGDHTVHITNTEFKKELGQLAGSSQFQSLLKSASFAVAGDQKSTTGTNLSATYLSQVVEQSAIDAEVISLKIPASTEPEATAELHAKEGFALNSEISQDAQGNQQFTGTGVVFLSFPKSLQKTLVDRQIRTDSLIGYFTNPTLAKEKALYNEFAPTICPSGRVVDQILVKDAATANSILAQLRAGASFATLAKAKSTDAASAKVGGSVGCLSKGTFVQEFETAAYAAPFDVPVGPVKSKFGYHVILVRHPTFADSEAELTTALQQNPLIARDLRMEAMKVWINPLFGTGGLAVNAQQGTLVYRVVPPAAPTPRVCREDSAICSGTTTTTTTTTVPSAVPGG
jgi:parvulin-like peptidyl-prolyl isomerase